MKKTIEMVILIPMGVLILLSFPLLLAIMIVIHILYEVIDIFKRK